jgi:2-iminobutanoate/2-iminopropanoate deaminase
MKPVPKDLLEKFAAHAEWLRTLGSAGRQLLLENVDLSGMDLSERDLMEAALPGVRFDQAVLRGCMFGGANLASASFLEADLAGADLTKETWIMPLCDTPRYGRAACARFRRCGSSLCA